MEAKVVHLQRRGIFLPSKRADRFYNFTRSPVRWDTSSFSSAGKFGRDVRLTTHHDLLSGLVKFYLHFPIHLLVCRENNCLSGEIYGKLVAGRNWKGAGDVSLKFKFLLCVMPMCVCTY